MVRSVVRVHPELFEGDRARVPAFDLQDSVTPEVELGTVAMHTGDRSFDRVRCVG